MNRSLPRSWNLAAWIAITLTLLSPLAGFTVEGLRLALQGEDLLALATTRGAVTLGLMAALGLAGLAGCTHQLKLLFEERALAVAQSNFVSGVTHELRTPVATIRLNADMMRQGLVPEPEQQAVFLASIVHECDRLTHLIDDVMAYALAAEGSRPYHLEPVPARALVEDALAAVRGPLREAGLEVRHEVPEGLAVRVDREAFTRALINILGNAAKYAPHSGPLSITVREAGSEAVFAIADAGPGIPPEEQKKIFQPFYRVGDELTRTHPGCGLGLALVAETMKAHRGRVEVESLPGAGATFKLTVARSPLA